MLHCLSAKLSTIVKSLCIARVLRHFVLIPHEIWVNKLLLTETIYSRDQQYFIKKLPPPTWFHNCRIYPSKNTPYSVAFSEKAPPFRFITSQSSWQIGCRFSIASDTPRHKRAYASQSSFRHCGWAARPAAGHKIADGKRKKTCHMTCLFSNRQLSILPGRFQPSTFDV